MVDKATLFGDSPELDELGTRHADVTDFHRARLSEQPVSAQPPLAPGIVDERELE
ncbi:hypothetical protein ACFFSY_15630 [Paenibacillus aurantiacus]|uniref:Uncharacterized protein n=1 Tax=Paenibacillus aurantiacus TaxID=1936118 RepID=A0ABV5KSG7_9BACL